MNYYNKKPHTINLLVISSVVLLSCLTISLAHAESAINDKRQVQIDRFESRILNIESKLDTTSERLTELYVILERAESKNNTNKITNTQERITKQKKRVSNLQDKIFKYQNMINILQGNLVSFDDLSRTIDLEIKAFADRTDRFAVDQVKIDKINRQFNQKFDLLKEAYVPALDAEFNKTFGVTYQGLTESEKSDVISYVLSEKFKIAMQKKIESDLGSNTHSINLFGLNLLPKAFACNDEPDVQYIAQVVDDIYGNISEDFEGENYLVSIDKTMFGCMEKYTLTYTDEDHPYSWLDDIYDGYRIRIYPDRDGPQDIESFYVYNDNIIFANQEGGEDFGSGSHEFYDVNEWGLGYHIEDTDTFSNIVYVNTWNHMMDTTDTNPSMTKYWNANR